MFGKHDHVSFLPREQVVEARGRHRFLVELAKRLRAWRGPLYNVAVAAELRDRTGTPPTTFRVVTCPGEPGIAEHVGPNGARLTITPRSTDVEADLLLDLQWETLPDETVLVRRTLTVSVGQPVHVPIPAYASRRRATLVLTAAKHSLDVDFGR